MGRFLPFLNFFLTSTRKNNRKLARIGKYMYDALTENAGDTFIASCLADLSTPHASWVGKVAGKAAAAGPQHGAVSAKDGVMAIIHGTDLRVWDRNIQNFYDETTDIYKTIFPNGHTKLHEGGTDDQLIELDAIITNMIPYSLLNTIRATMTTRYNEAFVKETAVAQKKAGKTTAKTTLTAERPIYGDVLFKLYCKLGNHYGADADILAIYIDVAEIQRTAKDNIFDKIAVKHSIAQIAIRTYLPDEEIEINNSMGTKDLKFYVIRRPGEPKGIFVTVPAGQTLSFARHLFGNMLWRYFMVENDDLTTDCHYILTFPN